MCTLTTLRPDGTPHVVPVGVTYDPEARLARVITSKSSAKVRHVLAAGPDGARVAVCQMEGRRWATLEGRASSGPSRTRSRTRSGGTRSGTAGHRGRIRSGWSSRSR